MKGSTERSQKGPLVQLDSVCVCVSIVCVCVCFNLIQDCFVVIASDGVWGPVTDGEAPMTANAQMHTRTHRYDRR